MNSTHPYVFPSLIWHGGLYYLAHPIVALMPTHTHYVEPFAGGLSVLLAKDPEVVSDVVNDRHRELSNFWRMLQRPESFDAFCRTLDAVPFSEIEWQEADRDSVAGLGHGPHRRGGQGFSDGLRIGGQVADGADDVPLTQSVQAAFPIGGHIPLDGGPSEAGHFGRLGSRPGGSG